MRTLLHLSDIVLIIAMAWVSWTHIRVIQERGQVRLPRQVIGQVVLVWGALLLFNGSLTAWDITRHD